MKQRTLGYRLQVARDAYGREHLDPPRTLRPGEFAKLAGVSAQAVNHWENDAREPSLETIAHLAATLEVRAAWLAWGEEPMRSHEATSIALNREFPNHGAKDADVFLDDMDAKQREAEAAKKKSPRRRAQ